MFFRSAFVDHALTVGVLHTVDTLYTVLPGGVTAMQQYGTNNQRTSPECVAIPTRPTQHPTYSTAPCPALPALPSCPAPWPRFDEPLVFSAMGQYLGAYAEMTSFKSLATGETSWKPCAGGSVLDGCIRQLTKNGDLPTLDFLAVCEGYVMFKVNCHSLLTTLTTYYLLVTSHYSTLNSH